VAILPGAGIFDDAIESCLGGNNKDIDSIDNKATTSVKKLGGNKKMSGIESNIMPFVSTIGFGGIAGFLIGFALKRIMKILAVIAGVFFAALMYLESQHIVNVNWDKLQTISNSILSTITTTAATNATSTTGAGGVGSIQV
jgi:uncharacterized membrane protein (Fun14 family)